MDFSDKYNNLIEKISDLSKYSNDELKKLFHEAEDIEKQYKNLQLVVKCNANSLYGTCASVYFSLCDFDLAEDITMIGKRFTVIVDRAINNFFKNWDENELKIIQEFYPQVISLRQFLEYSPDTKNDLCVYGDTDSRYIDLGRIYSLLQTKDGELKLPESDEELANFGCFIVDKFINKVIKNRIEEECELRNARKGFLKMSHEVTCRKSIFLKKKKYILNARWKDGKLLKKPKLKFTGVELKKGSSAPKIKKILEKLVNKYLLDNYTISMLRDESLKLVKYIKIKKEKDLIYQITSVSGTKDCYKNDKNVWVSDKNHIQMQIYLSWLNFIEENKLHNEYKPAFNGQKMNWYYCTPESPYKVMGVPDDININNVKGLPEPDWNRMINVSLLKPLLRYILEVDEIEDEHITAFLLGVKQWNFQ